MEARLGKIEALADRTVERPGALACEVAVIKSNYATRSDITDAMNSIVMWMSSAILLARLLSALMAKLSPI